jgi:hypothetical protein
MLKIISMVKKNIYKFILCKFYNYINMKIQLVILYIVIIGCISCITSKSKKASAYSKVQLTFIMPYAISPVLVDTTPVIVGIVYVGDYVMYELQRRKINSLNEKPLHDTIKIEYFVFNKKQHFGYLYQSLNDDNAVKLSADSILNKRGLRAFSLKPGFNSNSYVRYLQRSKNEVMYVYDTKEPDGNIDSAYLYFNKEYKSIQYSISAKLDSSFDSKFFRMEFLAKKSTGENADYINQFRMISLTMKPVPVTNEKELDAFFERYKKMEAALKP